MAALGHFSVPVRQRLILAWDGRSLKPGRYVVAVRAGSDTTRSHFTLR